MLEMFEKEEIIMAILFVNALTIYLTDFVMYANVAALFGLVYFYMQLKDPSTKAMEEINRGKAVVQGTPKPNLLDSEPVDIKDFPKLVDEKKEIETVKDTSTNTSKFVEESKAWIKDNALDKYVKKFQDVVQAKNETNEES